MKTYLVGGAVRDALLGLAPGDRDWVVVGSTPEEMLAQGFVPVGKDFPVFLHPQTREEYALARTERKSAPGYKGFVFHADPQVTLEQDLARRDFTVNAIAPGFIATDMTAPIPDNLKEAFIKQIPAQRFGEAAEIAAAAVYLASREAAYTTGATLHVNGGMYVG